MKKRSATILYHFNPLSMAQSLWLHRDLIQQFTKREIEGRYKGSILGLVWSFIIPLMQLLIYTFAFGLVLKARWPQSKSNSLAEFAVLAFCGLMVYNIFSECVSRAPTIIISVPSYVKKVVFPLEILPITVLASALFHMLISLGILLVAIVLTGFGFHWTFLLFPVILLPMVFLCLGLMWFLASLGVFLRDINYTVALMVQVSFFLTPIFYPFESIPEPFRTVIRFNPLASLVENARRVLIWGSAPSWTGYIFWLVATMTFMVIAFVWFIKTKKAFADVI